MALTDMRGVVYHGPQDVRIEARSLPDCGPEELRVKVDACAVCGTDLKAWMHGNPRIQPPIVLGHEFTGLIETVGDRVEGFAQGERIVMATTISCGECVYCRRGHPNLCLAGAPMGYSYNGGMADYVTIPTRAVRNGHVIKVPNGVSAVHAALAEPISCTVNAAENCRIQGGDTVVVVGAGPMGIINACMAREFGASKIILAEVNEARLAQAKAFGFDRLVNSATEDLAAAVKEETDGVGADVVIVAAPAGPPQEEALDLVRKRGTVCLFASLPVGKSLLSFDSRKIHYGEVCVVGTSDSSPAHVRRAVELIGGGNFPLEKLVSHVLPLEGIFDAFDLMTSGQALRVVLIP